MMQLEGAISLWATILGSQSQWLIPWCKQPYMILSLHPTQLLHHIQCKCPKWPANSKLSCCSSSSSSSSSRWWWWWWWASNNSNLQIILETLMEAVSTPMAQVCRLFKHTIHTRAEFRRFTQNILFMETRKRIKQGRSVRFCFLDLECLKTR